MAKVASNITSEIGQLSSILLASLDETLFFVEISKFLISRMKTDRVLIYKVLGEGANQLIVKNKKFLKRGVTLKNGAGSAGYVVRTKRPYFSNNVERDPIFSEEAKAGVKAELAIPIAHEGIVMATIHFQTLEGDREFSREDMNSVISILNELKMPISNMKMYLAAKDLNIALMKQIEEKEKELEEREKGITVADSFKVSEQDIIGKSEVMSSVLQLVDKLAMADANALIQGEIGTGKEMMARRIHCRSSRMAKAFASIDCSSLAEDRLEMEIFGYENSSMAHGSQIVPGLIESVDGGTLMIYRIDNLSPRLQAKLHQFIKDGITFRALGKSPYRSDVRIIAVTDKDLSVQVSENLFREDLLYALNTVVLNVPALRDRKEDIELLATHFLNKSYFADEQKSFSPGALKALRDYSWPGNTSELINIVERAYIMADGMIVERDHLAENVLNCEEDSQEEEDDSLLSYAEMTLNELERTHICRTLEYLGGNKTKTAKVLGITVKTLYNKLHSYGLIEAKEV